MTDDGPHERAGSAEEHGHHHEGNDGEAHDAAHSHEHVEDHQHDHHEHAPEADPDGHHDHHAHEHHAHDAESLGVAILTVSTSRTLDADSAGDAIEVAFESEGHEVVLRELVRDEYDSIQGVVKRLVDREDTDVVVTTGGTGITPDDVTVEAVRPLLGKRLPGFGELFRALSREEIGTRVVGTRATAGIADNTPVFCLPGSENAARLGAHDVIVPEAPHLVGLAQRGADDASTDG